MGRTSTRFIPGGKRWCPRCEKMKDLDDFRVLQSKAGRDAYCFDCRRAATTEWRKGKGRDRFVASQAKSRGKKEGGVYIVDIGIDHLYKIGKCIYLKDRIRDLSAANPKIQLVMFIPSEDPISLESDLHKLMDAKHIERELYSLSDDDIATIKETYTNETPAKEE